MTHQPRASFKSPRFAQPATFMRLPHVEDPNGLVLRGGWPGGGLRELAGVWVEEIDSLYPSPSQRIVLI